MKIAKILFKPKWQDKDAAVRKAAIAAGGNDAELGTALPEIARRDEDAGVRLAALRRLDDYEAWRERSTGDTDPHVRSAARETYLSMLSSGVKAPPVARRIAELETLHEDEIERVAVNAADVTLRRDALARVGKQTFLAQRAALDADATLRLELVARISDATLLERIAERTRKTDKNVSRLARERLQAARIDAGDASAIAAHALALCERAEALMRAPPVDSAAAVNALQSEWNALGGAVPAAISARFRGACALAQKAAEPRPAPVTRAPEPATPAHEPIPMPAPVVPAPAADAAALEHARAERTKHKAWRQELDHALAEFSAALDAGDTAHAHRLHARIEELRTHSADLSRESRERVEQLQPRYAELKRWQHWSNNQRRRTLCTEIDSLVASGAHPDALATRVHEAREEWRQLNIAEGASDDAEAAAGLARRFHGVCASALRPTRAYFAKRKEVRQTHAQEIDSLLASAATIVDDSNDWKAIAEMQSQASRALRTLDGVDPRQRTQLAKQLKEVIARMAALSAAHERDVEAAKARLIAQAGTLDGADAAREARELQRRWTALGNGRRATDQKQWREFRAACDAVFGKLDVARKQREDAAGAARAQAQAVLDDYAALATANSDAESTRKQLRELDARWNAVAADDRVALKRQRELRDAITLQLKNAERRKRLGRFHAALQKYAALRAVESGGDRADFDALPSAAEFDASLAQRRARAGTATEADVDSARETLVALEFLAGIESPAEDRQRRMNHQVQRLSSRLREGAGADPEAELSALLQHWFAQNAQTTALEERFVAAANAAIDSLP